MVLIQIKNLWKRYGPNQVLRGLNLDIIQGETVVVLGRSGAGKSVLLRHIIGLEPPDEGEILINGKNLSGLKGPELYNIVKNMGMLFQGSALFDSMSVAENVGFYLNQHGDPKTGEPLAKKLIAARVKEALAMVGLDDAADKLPADLSGGMRKRTALARLLAYRPHILLYDEPTTGLDPLTAMQINELILKTQAQLQATSIVVTHDVQSAMIVGNRLAFHSDGKISYIAKKEEFAKTSNPLIQKFLEAATPRTNFAANRSG